MQYITKLMEWIEKQINNEDLFPSQVGTLHAMNQGRCVHMYLCLREMKPGRCVCMYLWLCEMEMKQGRC